MDLNFFSYEIPGWIKSCFSSGKLLSDWMSFLEFFEQLDFAIVNSLKNVKIT